METFFFSLILFLIAFYLGDKWGKTYYISRNSLKTSNKYLDLLMKEVDRRKNLSKLAKTRKRVNGRFVKE